MSEGHGSHREKRQYRGKPGGQRRGSSKNNGISRNNQGRDWDNEASRNRQHGRGRKGHAQRGGRGREHDRPFHPQRARFREERDARLRNEPQIPEDISADELDALVMQDLGVLAKNNRITVARHLVATAAFLNSDPERALRHARAAKERAGRVGVARETNGIAAYHNGLWKEALSELRTARRISGGPGMMAVMADCLRGLGRPEAAISMLESPEVEELNKESVIELHIVVSGAYRDIGQGDKALELLQASLDDVNLETESAARLFFAYAETLRALGKDSEAKKWYTQCLAVDSESTVSEDAAAALTEIGTTEEEA